MARVLGPVRLERDGRVVDLGGARARTVLARLVAAGGNVVSMDRLISDVWGVAPPAKVVASLHSCISHLRDALEPERGRNQPSVLARRGTGYSLLLTSDADLLQRATAEAALLLDQGLAQQAQRVLSEGMSWWQGEPYADIDDLLWVNGERARCQEVHLIAAETLALAHLSLGANSQAVLLLSPLCTLTPPRERVASLCAVALFREQRQAEALALTRRVRQALVEELGLDPGVEFRAVEAAILAQDNGRLPASVPPPIPVVQRPQAKVGLGDRQPEAGLTGGPARLMVGRARPLAVLSAVAAAVVGGQPRTVIVSGEAGIGKTRLVDAFADDLRAQGWTVVAALCSDSAGAPALWPWIRILHQLSFSHPLPESLRGLVAANAGRETRDVQAARWRQTQDIGAYLRTVAEAGPLLLVIEDLHWSDEGTAQLFGELLPALTGIPVALAVTTRPAASPTLTDALARVARAGVVRLSLDGLTPDDVAELAQATGLEVDPAALAARTAGNPFLLQETLALASSTGASPLDVVPATVRDVLLARIALLPGCGEHVLAVAAVLGSTVDPALVAHLAGLSVVEVEQSLDEAADAGLLLSTASGQLRFVHDLIRETAYGQLPPLRRTRLHAAALRLLADQNRSGPAELAVHAAAAGPDHALAAHRYAAAAAEQAQARLAYGSAVDWWRRALDTEDSNPTPDPRRRLDTLLALVRAQLDVGDAVGAVETRGQAVRVADLLHNRSQSAKALVALDRPMLWILREHDHVATDMVSRIDRALQETGHQPAVRCALEATLALELYSGIQNPRCDTLSASALATARGLGDVELLAFTLNSRQLAIAFPGRERERVEIAKELVALGVAEDRPTVELVGHQLAASAYLQLAQLEMADQHADAARHLAAALNLTLPMIQQRMWDSSRTALDGRFDDALRLLDDAEALHWPWWGRDAMMATVRLALLLRARRYAELEPLLDLASYVHPRLAIDARVLWLVSRGERAAAAAAYVSVPTALPRDWTWLAAACVQAQAAAACGRPAEMAAAEQQLKPWSARIAAAGSIDAGRVCDYLAALQ